MIVSVQMREGLGVLLDLLQVVAPQPLGRQLDRGQRVLDLVGDAAGDIGPGRLALRRQQFGDVVEGDDKAADLIVAVLGGDAHQQRAGAVAAGELNLRLRQPVGPALGLVQQHRHLGRDFGEVLPDRQFEIDAEQRRGRAVGQVDAAVAIEPDHPGRDAGQHRLGEAAPLVELPVGLDSSRCWLSIWLVIRLKARLNEASSSSFSPSGTRAARSPARTCSAAPTRRLIGTRELGREMDADRHRGDQEQHRHHHEDQRRT